MRKAKQTGISLRWLYPLFFLTYFVILYLALYHHIGAQPFQVSHHFTANVLSSLLKRFLGETIPYAALMIPLYYSRTKWLRISLILLFLLIFTLSIVNVFYYYLIQANFQFYVFQNFSWYLLFSYFNIKVMLFLVLLVMALVGMGMALYRLRSREKVLPPISKQVVVLALLLVCSWRAYLTPTLYDYHTTAFTRDQDTKKMGRVMELEDSFLTLLHNEVRANFIPQQVKPLPFTEDEKMAIEERGLDVQLTTPLEHPPKKIVLIIGESLNQDFMSAYNPNISSTPFMDSLIKDYQHVDAFYPSGPFTLHGLVSLLCGHTNLEIRRNFPNHICAPRILAEKGYQNSFIRGATKYYVSENVAFKKFGYDEVFAREEFNLKFPEYKEKKGGLYNTWGFTDDYVLNEVAERLEKANEDEKLFLTALLVDGHTPGGRCGEGGPSTPQKDPILFSASCMDLAIKSFVERLEKNNLINEDLLIMITSDQLLPKPTNIPGDRFLISFRLHPGRIPFIMIADQNLKLVAKQGSQVDIAATLIDLANGEIPSYYMGKSLISNPNTTPVGQDRDMAYIITNEGFQPLTSHWLDLSKNNGDLEKKGPTSQLLKINTQNAGELERRAEIMRRERDANITANVLLYKWYYNKYHTHKLN